MIMSCCRFVTIDENSSSLEYIRERAELCGVEAKIWLSGRGSASWTSTVTGNMTFHCFHISIVTYIIFYLRSVTSLQIYNLTLLIIVWCYNDCLVYFSN